MAGQFQGIRSEFTEPSLGPRTPLRPLPHLAAKPLRPIGTDRSQAAYPTYRSCWHGIAAEQWNNRRQRHNPTSGNFGGVGRRATRVCDRVRCEWDCLDETSPQPAPEICVTLLTHSEERAGDSDQRPARQDHDDRSRERDEESELNPDHRHGDYQGPEVVAGRSHSFFRTISLHCNW
jgi:hypothetical protein